LGPAKWQKQLAQCGAPFSLSLSLAFPLSDRILCPLSLAHSLPVPVFKVIA